MGRSAVTVIARGPVEIGGEVVTSSVPDGHKGPYEIVSESGGHSVAVLQDWSQARRVACYAITQDGGFGSVEIRTTDELSTHDTFEDWLGAGF
jgi:hypothetical protein